MDYTNRERLVGMQILCTLRLWEYKLGIWRSYKHAIIMNVRVNM